MISAVVSIYLITSTTIPQIPVLVLRPECGARFAPSVHDDLRSKTDFPYPYFRCRKRGYFRFRILPNHLAFFFLSLVTEWKHLLAFTLTHILYFLWQAMRNWPILLFLFLEVSRNTLFLFSQRETTWQYIHICIMKILPTWPRESLFRLHLNGSSGSHWRSAAWLFLSSTSVFCLFFLYCIFFSDISL